MKYIYIILFLIYSSDSYSSSCVLDKESTEILSKEYLSAVNFEFHEAGEEIDVEIEVPFEIRGLKFHSAIVVRGDVNTLDFDFMFPLAANIDGSGVHLHYMVKKSLLSSNFIQLKYGAGCGKTLQYAVHT